MPGFAGGNPFLPGLSPYGAAGRPAAAFDPIAAWYMAHYGTPGETTGLSFGGAGLPFSGFFAQVGPPAPRGAALKGFKL